MNTVWPNQRRRVLSTHSKRGSSCSVYADFLREGEMKMEKMSETHFRVEADLNFELR